MYFDKGLTSGKKTEKALLYGKILTEAYQKTDDDVFLIIAHGFLGRMENDLCYRGGADEDIAKVTEKKLQTLAILSENARKNSVMKDAVFAKNNFWQMPVTIWQDIGRHRSRQRMTAAAPSF